MKFLSIKESLAIVEIVMGSLCLYNFVLTDFYDEKLFDLTLFKHRCLSISLAFMCFFNALGTWFWFSKLKKTKMLNRLHKILVYFVLNILLIATHFLYKRNYSGPLMWQYFDGNIFFDEVQRIQTSSVVVLLILILSLVLVGFNGNYIRFRTFDVDWWPLDCKETWKNIRSYAQSVCFEVSNNKIGTPQGVGSL